MPLTPETLTRHELCGLPVRVAAAASDAYVGIAGRVVSESQRTLTIRVRDPHAGDTGDEDRDGDKRVPKADTTFVFALPAAASGTEADNETDDSVTGNVSQPTDEAAGARKPPGSAFELPSPSPDTPPVGRRQDDTAGVTAGQSGGCEDAVYVTVDGVRLLSRPAFRTERAGDSTWQ